LSVEEPEDNSLKQPSRLVVSC